MRFQQAYSAASRVIQVARDTLPVHPRHPLGSHADQHQPVLRPSNAAQHAGADRGRPTRSTRRSRPARSSTRRRTTPSRISRLRGDPRRARNDTAYAGNITHRAVGCCSQADTDARRRSTDAASSAPTSWRLRREQRHAVAERPQDDRRRSCERSSTSWPPRQHQGRARPAAVRRGDGAAAVTPGGRRHASASPATRRRPRSRSATVERVQPSEAASRVFVACGRRQHADRCLRRSSTALGAAAGGVTATAAARRATS